MAGAIKHAWNGTILAITSDSGTSSMDLKGPTGDIGPRGPQGPCGVIYNEDGVILADNLATEEYVDWKADEILSKLENRVTIYNGTNLHYNYVDANEEVIETNYINFDNTETVSYRFRIVYADGSEEIIDTALKDVSGVTGADLSEQSERLAAVLIGTDGKLAFFAINGQETDYIEELEIISITEKSSADLDLSAYATQEYVDSRFENIDVDVDLTDYATKTYVTEKIVEVTTGGSVSLDGYATEEYVDTSIEGIGLPREKVLADETGLNLTGYVKSFTILPEKLIIADTYRCTIGYSDGFVESQKIIKTGTIICSSERLEYILYHDKDFSLDCKTNEGYTVTSFKLEHFMRGVPLSPQAIPVDNETLKINEEGKIYCEVQEVDLTGYATEEYVNNKAANYYTKTEIDALLANLGPVYPSAEEVEY